MCVRNPYQDPKSQDVAIVPRYVRGNTVKFEDRLEGQKNGSIPSGPPVWIGGDCHIGNLGPAGNASGQIEIQIRDLDQTVVGNPAHDLIRWGCRLHLLRVAQTCLA